MLRTIVYDTCSSCRGTGTRLVFPADPHAQMKPAPCETCGATGKGAVREIRESVEVPHEPPSAVG